MSGEVDSSHNQLEQLFLACDSKGTGFIGRQEMRELCRSFDISAEDSDLIFADLDGDGDNKISFADFCRGFRDCVNSDFASATTKREEDTAESKHKREVRHEKTDKADKADRRDKKARKKTGLRRRDSMHYAFKQFSKTLGEENVLHFIGNSQEKIHQLYQELVSSDADPQLRRQVESVLGSLLGEVRQLQEENKHMEKLYIREKETHEERLRSMEDELEAQVARVDSQARREAEQKKEQEIKQVELKMKEEIAELQMHLRMFQKVDDWLQKDTGKGVDEATLKRLEDATNENRGLRMNLTETETGIALMRAEMAQIRSQYEEKCRELHSERQQLEEYVARQDQIQRQLQVLQEANRRIQDTNDSLRQAIQDGNGSRPRRTQRPGSQMSSTLGDELDSLWDGESLRSFSSGRRAPHPDEVQFGIPRLMQDLDSRSLKDPDDLDSGLDRSVRDEAESSLDRSVRGDLDDLEAQQDNSIDECLLTTTDQYVELPRSVRPSPAPSPRASPRFSPRAAAKSSSPAPAPPIDTSSPTQMALREATGPPDRTYKVVFAGDAAVGKSTFITRVCKGVFVTDISSTLGVDFQVKTLCVDDKNVAVQLWDTAGQERFRSITKSYFRRADGVMLLYDVTSERSFVNVRSWVQSIDEVTDTRVPIMLCGNKVDMREELMKKGHPCVTRQQGESLARDFGAHFQETSARSGTGMVEAIVELGRRMLTNEDVEVQTSALKVAEDARKSGTCSGSGSSSSSCKK